MGKNMYMFLLKRKKLINFQQKAVFVVFSENVYHRGLRFFHICFAFRICLFSLNIAKTILNFETSS